MTNGQKTAVITGASQGIGAAAARHLATLGWNVVAVARNAAALDDLCAEITRDGGRAIAVSADVADYPAMEQAMEAAVAQFSTIDLLVNNAGVIDPIARIESSDPQAWATAISVNLTGAYNAIRAAMPKMLQQGSGIVINISSGAATSALEGWSHYCASKAGLLSLTRCAHKELAEHGIRVVGLSPGTVATDMQTKIRDSGVNPVSQLSPDVHIPPEWVAKAIAWLSTDDSREFDGEDFSLKTPEGRARVGLSA